jgi:hypothetical protein
MKQKQIYNSAGSQDLLIIITETSNWSLGLKSPYLMFKNHQEDKKDRMA